MNGDVEEQDVTDRGLPLAGTTVVDMSTSYAGPTASMYLADLGATVLKVERPGGDDARAWGPPFVGDTSAWFHSVNRGKRSVGLDLRRPEGMEALHRLLEGADAFIGNLNPAKLALMGLDPEAILGRHEHLVYCLVSGFGLTGPDADRPGYDLAAQARSGLMSVTGEAGGTPQRVSTALSDITTGLVGAFGIVAALHRRTRTGRGGLVDVSLLDTDLALMAPRIASYLAGEPEPAPSGGRDSVIAVYQAFETADRPIVVALGNDSLWRRFCDAAELPELGSDPELATNAGRRQHRPRILALIEERLLVRTAAEWLALLRDADVPASPIQSLSEVVDDPQVQARFSLQELTNGVRVVRPPWRFDGRPTEVEHPDPVGPAGADTWAVLAAAGYDGEVLEHLFAVGAAYGDAPTKRSVDNGGERP